MDGVAAHADRGIHRPSAYTCGLHISYVQAKTTPKAICVQTSGSSALHQWQVMLCFAAVCGVPCCQVPSQSWQLLAYLSIIARSNVRSLMWQLRSTQGQIVDLLVTLPRSPLHKWLCSSVTPLINESSIIAAYSSLNPSPSSAVTSTICTSSPHGGENQRGWSMGYLQKQAAHQGQIRCKEQPLTSNDAIPQLLCLDLLPCISKSCVGTYWSDATCVGTSLLCLMAMWHAGPEDVRPPRGKAVGSAVPWEVCVTCLGRITHWRQQFLTREHGSPAKSALTWERCFDLCLVTPAPGTVISCKTQFSCFSASGGTEFKSHGRASPPLFLNSVYFLLISPCVTYTYAYSFLTVISCFLPSLFCVSF